MFTPSMISAMIDPIIVKLTPHVHTASERASMFQRGLFARLDMILMALSEDDFELTDPRMRVNIGLVNGDVEIAQVPANEEWLLEFVSFDMTVTSPVKIKNGDRIVWAKPTATQGAFPGDGFIAPGGSILSVNAVQIGSAYLQFRRRMPNMRVKRAAAGMIEIEEPGSPPRRILDQDSQHTGTTRIPINDPRPLTK